MMEGPGTILDRTFIVVHHCNTMKVYFVVSICH